MIRLTDFSFSFTGEEQPVLRRVSLAFSSGTVALIAGPTGSGKSTLLRALNGLVPHFSGGRATGGLEIDGRSLAGCQPHEFAHLVGYVNQQPEGSFVAATVREELAFGMEQLGIDAQDMAVRIDAMAKRMGIEHLLDSPTEALSGGQQQRVAIAAAIVAGQQVLLLDEPTSALDPVAAGELIELLRGLADRHGITVILAEHRIERLLGRVDSLTVVHGDGSVSTGLATDGFSQLLANYKLVPPVVELGQKLRWNPLPLTIEDATQYWQAHPGVIARGKVAEYGPTLLKADEISVEYPGVRAVDRVSLQLHSGEVLAIVGPNGSGKSSLLWALQGEQKHNGNVAIFTDGWVSPSSLRPAQLLQHLAMVPQTASDLLMLSRLADELAESDSFAQKEQGTTAAIFAALTGRIDPRRHPRDLSSGQQLALVLAIQLAKGARILLLDEPTRGLDYEAKRRLSEQLAMLKEQGHAIAIASHDIEFLATVADNCLLLNQGVAAQFGTAEQVLTTLGAHAPQVWQVTHRALSVWQVQP